LTALTAQWTCVRRQNWHLWGFEANFQAVQRVNGRDQNDGESSSG
jgi:hypothetical protein